MKKVLLLSLMMMLFIGSGKAQRGMVMESLTFQSGLTDDSISFAIYLPPGYDSETQKYPILYLLHGFSDDESGWVQFGQIKKNMDDGILAGDFPPVIVVMPDGGITWYANDINGEFPWNDIFINEFIPFIEQSYRVREGRQFRGVGGLSMGGFGALHLSMNHRALFGTCLAFSAAVFEDQSIIDMPDVSYERYGFKRLFGDEKDKGKRINDQYKKYSPLHLVENIPAQELNSIQFYIDCGDDDFLDIGNCELHKKMKMRGVKHEYRMRNGDHSWPYWRQAIKDGMAFFGKVTTR